MSKYKVIATQYTDRHALIAALKAAGIAFEIAEDEGLTLYGYEGDPRREKAHIVVRRKHISSASNDLGFLWDDDAGAYRAIVSQYDESCDATTNIRNRIRQEYAAGRVMAEAKKRGLSVERVTDETGQIRLKLKGRMARSQRNRATKLSMRR